MRLSFLPALALATSLSSCAFHSTANEWNERVGPNGNPVYVKSSTSVGFNLLVLLRIVGATDTATLIDEMTEEIAEEHGDRVRIIQSDTENYWYGFPPFTWIVTPVVTTVVADYEPHPEVLAEDNAAREADE